MTADPKPPARVVDRGALRTARLAGDECAACGRPPGSVHHVIERSEGGDDVPGNLLLLCGSGTTGCHGAWHGNTYEVTYHRWVGAGHDLEDERVERRDRAWVGQRLGEHIAVVRPDVAEYVRGKLGADAGDAYMARRYGVATETPEQED